MKAKGTYAYVHGDEPYLSYSFFVSEIEGTDKVSRFKDVGVVEYDTKPLHDSDRDYINWFTSSKDVTESDLFLYAGPEFLSNLSEIPELSPQFNQLNTWSPLEWAPEFKWNAGSYTNYNELLTLVETTTGSVLTSLLQQSPKNLTEIKKYHNLYQHSQERGLTYYILMVAVALLEKDDYTVEWFKTIFEVEKNTLSWDFVYSSAQTLARG